MLKTLIIMEQKAGDPPSNENELSPSFLEEKVQQIETLCSLLIQNGAHNEDGILLDPEILRLIDKYNTSNS